MMANYLLTGAGMVEVDVTLGILAATAAAIQYWRIACWRSSVPVYVGRWLQALGWTTLAARIGQTLTSTGDILISLPSLISLILVASGSIMVAVFWAHNNEGNG